MVIKKNLAFLLCATYLTTSPVFSMDPPVVSEDQGLRTTVRRTTVQDTFIAKQQKEEEERTATLNKHAMRFYQAKKAGAPKEQLANIVREILQVKTVATLRPELSQWVEVLPTPELQKLLASYKESHQLATPLTRSGSIMDVHAMEIYKAIGSNINIVFTEIEKRK